MSSSKKMMAIRNTPISDKVESPILIPKKMSAKVRIIGKEKKLGMFTINPIKMVRLKRIALMMMPSSVSFMKMIFARCSFFQTMILRIWPILAAH